MTLSPSSLRAPSGAAAARPLERELAATQIRAKNLEIENIRLAQALAMAENRAREARSAALQEIADMLAERLTTTSTATPGDEAAMQRAHVKRIVYTSTIAAVQTLGARENRLASAAPELRDALIHAEAQLRVAASFVEPHRAGDLIATADACHSALARAACRLRR